MHKQHVGHHLLRVRIRKVIFQHLKEAAEVESERTGLHITVSDLVRQACVNYLLLHQAQQRLLAVLEAEAEDAIIQALIEMGEIDPDDEEWDDDHEEDEDDDDDSEELPEDIELFHFHEARLN